MKGDTTMEKILAVLEQAVAFLKEDGNFMKVIIALITLDFLC